MTPVWRWLPFCSHSRYTPQRCPVERRAATSPASLNLTCAPLGGASSFASSVRFSSRHHGAGLGALISCAASIVKWGSCLGGSDTYSPPFPLTPAPSVPPLSISDSMKFISDIFLTELFDQLILICVFPSRFPPTPAPLYPLPDGCLPPRRPDPAHH